MPRTQHVHVSSPLPLSCPLREVTSSLLLIGLFFRTSAPPFASPSLPILPHLDARPHRWPARSFRDPMFSLSRSPSPPIFLFPARRQSQPFGPSPGDRDRDFRIFLVPAQQCICSCVSILPSFQVSGL